MIHHTLRPLELVAMLCLLPATGLGQGPPGTNLLVHVRVKSISIGRDVTRITYVLKNDPRSRERLSMFFVSLPGSLSRVREIVRPSPQGSWMSFERFAERPVVGWSPLGPVMRPGQESPELVFAAEGLPAIVTSWVHGYTPPSTEIPSDTLPLRDLQLVADSAVGVEYDAVFASHEHLLIRLARLTAQVCAPALGWIRNATLCADLDTRLRTTRERLVQADEYAWKAQLRGFLSRLEAARRAGESVNDNAYWLLRANAGFLIKKPY